MNSHAAGGDVDGNFKMASGVKRLMKRGMCDASLQSKRGPTHNC